MEEDIKRWEKGREGEKGDVKRIRMYYVHAPSPHNECGHFVLQTFCTVKM